jgi:hypothetical protein
VNEGFPCWFNMSLTVQGGTVSDQWLVEDEAGLAQVRAAVLGHLERQLAAAHAPGDWYFRVDRAPAKPFSRDEIRN